MPYLADDGRGDHQSTREGRIVFEVQFFQHGVQQVAGCVAWIAWTGKGAHGSFFRFIRRKQERLTASLTGRTPLLPTVPA